jgi:amino acid adenylation domain-containing protein
MRSQDLTAAAAPSERAGSGIQPRTRLEVQPELGEAARSFGSAAACVPDEQALALHGFAGAHDIALRTIVEAAWGLLLARYTGELDVVFGRATAVRPGTSESHEVAVDPSAGSRLVRMSVDGEATVVSWLRDEAAAAGRLETGLDDRTASLPGRAPEEIVTGAPPCSTQVAFESCTREPGTAPGQPAGAGHVGPEFDVTLVAQADASLRFRLHYRRSCLGDAAANRLLGHLTMLLTGIASAGPRTRLADLPLLTPAEYDEVVVRWNATDVAYPQREARLEALVEAQVDRTPDAVAVQFEGATLTYRELDERANRVAHALGAAGIEPNTLVGVCLERSIDLVVAVLGVLKSGGAYVPLDPADPAERLAFIADDAGASVIITSAPLAQDVLRDAGGARLLVDDAAVWAAQPASRPAPSGTAADLAYVIYTSGSTGRPKGARVAHRGVVNRVLWMQSGSGFEIGARDRVPLVTPIGFDPSVQELFATLSAGARLVVAKPDGHADVRYLAGLIESAGITWMGFVPSLLDMVLDDPAAVAAARQSLRQAVCGGQVLPPGTVARFADRIGCPLYNLYGPTEATIAVTSWQCQPGDRSARVPIGRPTANTQLYLLDRWRQPVPVGVAGELYIGGVQVGRGYHRRPELTAERFVPDPFRPGPEARLYRTGDLARYRPDGAVEYLGRIDHQVKIRGIRIELGEIEAVLGAQPGIGDAAVMAREDSPGEKRLVAYIAGGTEVADEQLRAALLAVLPRYMVPAVFVRLDALPLTTSGKVDRQALPPPPAQGHEQAATFVAPRGPIEYTLASIWSSILSVSRVGREDNFFDLGGDSLQAGRLMNRVQDTFGVDLPLRRLLEARTLADLARLVVTARVALPAPPAIVTIQPDGPGLPLFAVPGHSGDVFSYVHLARELGTGRPFYALQPPGIEGKRAPLDSVGALAAFYVDAMRARHAGPYLLAGYCAGATVAFEMACQLVEQGRDVRLLVLIGAPHPSALSIGARTVARTIRHAGRLLRSPVSHARLLFKRTREPGDEEHPAGRHGYRVGRATVSAIGAYAPGRYPGRITLILPNARYAASLDRPLRWQEQTVQPVERLTGPAACGRDDMLRKPHVRLLAHQMHTLLARADESRT